MPQTIDFEWLVEGEIRSIPTSASKSNRECGKEFGVRGSATDTKTDTNSRIRRKTV